MNKKRLISLLISFVMLVTFTGCSAENAKTAATTETSETSETADAGIAGTSALPDDGDSSASVTYTALTCAAVSETSDEVPVMASEGAAETTALASSGGASKRGGLRYSPGIGTLSEEPDVMVLRKANKVGQIVGTLYNGESVNPNFYYYRCMLNDNGKSAYDTIHAGLLSGASTIKLSVPLSTDNVDIVFYSVLYDDPQIFWAEPGYSYTYNSSGYVISISPMYNSLAKDITGAKKAVEKSVSKALAVMWELPNNIERSKYAHDYLTHTIDYVDGDLDQNAYSALVQHKTVCAGYSQAYAYMMQKMGAPCAVVIGNSGGPHAWNIVMLDGESYVTDITWDDPYENPPDTYYYDYFNLTSRQMSQDHTLESPSTYLAPAYGTKASYYNYFGGNAYGTDFDTPVVISTEPSVTTTLYPTTTTKPPATTTKPPATTTKPPATTTKPPATTTKPPATTTRPPAATTKPPATTTKPPATTTKPPATTTTSPVTTPSDWDDYWGDEWWSEHGIDPYSNYDEGWWNYLDPYWEKDDWTYDEEEELWYIDDPETGYTYFYDDMDGSFYCMDHRGRVYWYDSRRDDWIRIE